MRESMRKKFGLTGAVRTAEEENEETLEEPATSKCAGAWPQCKETFTL